MRYSKTIFAKIITALTLLLIGGVLYLLFRPRTLLMHQIFDMLGFGTTLDSWRNISISLAMPEWCVYILPGALWSAAYIFIIDAILHDVSVAHRLSVAAFIPVAGVLSELLQLPAILPGTFDIADIAAYIVPFIIYLIIQVSDGFLRFVYLPSLNNSSIINFHFS